MARGKARVAAAAARFWRGAAWRARRYRGGHPTGKRHFSRDLGQDDAEKKKKEGEDDSSDEEESGSGSSSDSDDGGAGPSGGEEKPKASSAVEGLIETANPNAPRKATMKAGNVDLDAPQELSRREREAIEKSRAEERHWKLTQAGKTDAAQADLARLALIKAQREEAAKKRAEEKAAADAKKVPGGKK